MIQYCWRGWSLEKRSKIIKGPCIFILWDLLKYCLPYLSYWILSKRNRSISGSFIIEETVIYFLACFCYNIKYRRKSELRQISDWEVLDWIFQELENVKLEKYASSKTKIDAEIFLRLSISFKIVSAYRCI